jgi:hypothetical protein
MNRPEGGKERKCAQGSFSLIHTLSRRRESGVDGRDSEVDMVKTRDFQDEVFMTLRTVKEM